jgi:hypothetical protein
MDRSLGGEGLTQVSQEDDGGAVVLVLVSVDLIGGDVRISQIVVTMNQRHAADDGATLVTAEAA